MLRRVPLSDVRPTQLYLSGEKVESAAAWFDFDEPNYGTLPVFEHRGDWYLADGHTRAFLAHLAGFDTLRVERDESVREEHDFDLYRACVEWCADAGVRQVPDLAGRVVEPDTYEAQWVTRCREYGES